MSFYNEPAFWVFLGAFFGGVFGCIKAWFVYSERITKIKYDREMAIENKKSETTDKAIEFLNTTLSEMKPMVTKHETLMAKLIQSTEMVGLIEKGLTAMSANLEKQYDEFKRKIVNITTSFEIVLGRVKVVEDKIQDLGKVIIK